MAPEFQRGADILSTAIASSWDRIGKLAAIAIIRTGLNYSGQRDGDGEEPRRGRHGNGRPAVAGAAVSALSDVSKIVAPPVRRTIAVSPNSETAISGRASLRLR
jgi:hypothetical protein